MEKKGNRVNVALTTEEEKQIYRDLIAESAKHGIHMRTALLAAMKEGLARLQKSTLRESDPPMQLKMSNKRPVFKARRKK